MSSAQSTDKGAAFKGLIVTTLLLLVMVYSIMQLTNMKFASHAADPAAAAESH